MNLIFLLLFCHLLCISMETDCKVNYGCKRRSRKERRSEVEVYLMKYGYLEEYGNETSRKEFKEAIKAFQRHNGIKVTGKLNKVVMRIIKLPRCGYPDIEKKKKRYRRDSYSGLKWKYDLVTWGILIFSSKLRPFLQWRTLKKAMAFWGQHTPLRFKYRRNHPDIKIKFVRGNHGDGWYNAFDGEGKTLAHAFSPRSGLTHFDEDEPWSVYPESTGGVDLLQIAIHEIGHAIGLGHVTDRNAVMSAYVSKKNITKLNWKELSQIRYLYGTKENPKLLKRKRKRRRKRTYIRPLVVNTTGLNNPCEQINDLFLDGQGYANIFSGKIVYQVNKNGQRKHTPNFIRSRYAGAPQSFDAAVYLPKLNRAYFFKGNYVWRLTHYRVDSGFPKPVAFHRHHEVPRAALVLAVGRRTKIYLFGIQTFWEWNIKNDNVRKYVLPVNKYWRGLPEAPDAAMLWSDNFAYFIKGNKYYMVDPLRRSTQGNPPKPMPPPWMSPICRPKSSS